MFERGFGYRLAARRLGVSAETVREWQKMYRVIGRGGLLAMGVKQTRYDYETKVGAAREELEERVRKLEAQVAYLKKSIALKAQRHSQTGTKP